MGLALLVTGGPATAQTYLLNEVDIPYLAPANAGSESVRFGDVDQDGDLDALFATADPNRLWINTGGLQAGVVGVFADETDARLPSIDDYSRDAVLADYDGDGDLDYFTCNDGNHGHRWGVNQGGAQGGALGYYADETAARWVGLGGPGSSIATSLLLPSAAAPEAFIDWSRDAEFVDLDNDGDLDLFLSSSGEAFAGTVPSRIFLNDGAGFFSELNPSGVQLPSAEIADGQQGLWCEGVQQSGTQVVDGTQCDIATDCIDVEVGDVDGDLDLDIVLGAMQLDEPRLFSNRLAETGSLAFRDVTGTALAAVGTGDGFDQELADLDGDLDLELFGINWEGTWNDALYENDGAGTFTPVHTFSSSGNDDDAAEFVDFDNDGDLDVFVAAWDATNRLYRNDTSGGVYDFDHVPEEVQPVSTMTSTDVGVADVDLDGDYDLFVANHGRDRYLENFGDVADVTAPVLGGLEAVPGGAASAAPIPVRVYLTDNVPDFLAWSSDTTLELTVDGVAVPDEPMVPSGGRVFRGELPGNLVGLVEYAAAATDLVGNAGLSAAQQYTGTGPTGVSQGTATGSSVGIPSLRALTAPLAGAPLYLVGENVAPGSPGFFLASLTDIPGGIDLGFGAYLNVGLPFLTAPIASAADAQGHMVLAVGAVGAAFSGATLHVQALFLDGAFPATWASTQSLALSFP